MHSNLGPLNLKMDIIIQCSEMTKNYLMLMLSKVKSPWTH